MHPKSFLARAHARPVAFASSSSSPPNLLLSLSTGEMPPPYDLCASAPASSPTTLAASPPTAQPPMSLPLPISIRRAAPSPPKPLVTPPPYCASPPLVPVESRSPDLGAGAVDELKGTPGRRAGAGELGDDESGEGEEEYLALATPAQRSYFVTLSGLFEGAAVQSGEGASPGEVEEKEVLGKAVWLRSKEERDRGCGYSCCTVS
ncbi:hypothetical protein JCM9279_006759 [Rhodotorula babjevae]